MKALVADRSGHLALQEVPETRLRPDQVRVRTAVSAVSMGTELRMLYRDDGSTPGHPGWPAVGAFGYLAAGIVEEVGDEVDGVTVGQRVACGRAWGAHRERIDVDATSITPLPGSVDTVDAACAYWAVPPYCGILAARPRLDETVVVIGLGPLGLCAVQLLRGVCAQVIAIDTVRSRCEAAERYGAVVIDPDEPDVVAAVRRHDPDGPAAVLQVAGTQGALELAMALVRPLGRIVNVGTLQRLDDFDLFWSLQESGARLLPIHRPSAANPQLGGQESPRHAYLPSLLDAVVSGRLDISGICTSVLPIDQAPTAFPWFNHHPDRVLGAAFVWDQAHVAADRPNAGASAADPDPTGESLAW